MNVRQSTPNDYSGIYQLIQTAFLTAEHRDGNEQDFAVGLRQRAAYIPQLDLVAEQDGVLIGHIMLTKTYVALPDGGRRDTLLVAPLSVLFEHRKGGVGSALMRAGLDRAKELGYVSAFLIGDPTYYGRFGFRLSSEFGIAHESLPAEFVQAVELSPNSLDGTVGLISM